MDNYQNSTDKEINKVKNVTRIATLLTLSAGMFSIFLWLVGINAGPVYADPGVIYVSGDGSCGGNTPCYTTVQAAVDAASSGDEIRISAGIYTGSGMEVVSINKSLTLKGGYNSDFSTLNVNTYASILDGQNNRRVISIDSSSLTVTLNGLYIIRGNNSSSSGGGVRDYVGNNTLTIQNCQIYQNVANISGGGVFISDGSTATLTANEIYSNTSQGGDGGGVAVAQNGSLTMTSNEIYGNLVDWDASGGGVSIGENRTAWLTFNQIHDNRVGENGGGVSVGSATVITAAYNTISSNEAGTRGTAHGGGLYLYKVLSAALTGNTISFNKVAGRGGGVSVDDSDQVLLSGNTILNNQVTQYDGGGIYVVSSPNTQLENNLVGQNTAAYGGGVYISSSYGSMLAKMTIYGNTATGNGGGLYVSGSNGLTIHDSRLYGNTANDTTPPRALGGGITIVTSKQIQIINTVIADNVLNGDFGAGLAVWGSAGSLADVALVHTTIAHNTGGDGSGLYVEYGTATLTNTILVSHTVGIYADANGEAVLEATLWGADEWANGTDCDGTGTIVTGTHNYTGIPAFLSTAAGDYHIGTASAARNKGVDAGVTTDIDDEARPFENIPDLGADELVYSLGIVKDAPDMVSPGELITYTLTVTNDGYVTVTNVVITDVVPTGASYISGGALMPGNVVSWTLAQLAGHETATLQFVVTATDTIVNENYVAVCDERVTATGSPVTTAVARRVYLPLVLRTYGP